MGLGVRVILNPVSDRRHYFDERFIGLTGTVVEVFPSGYLGYNWQARVEFDDTIEWGYKHQFVQWRDCIVLDNNREINISDIEINDLF